MARLDILYAGSPVAGNFAKDVSLSEDLSFELRSGASIIPADIAEAISEKALRYVIVNLNNISGFSEENDHGKIISELTRLSQLSDSELVVHNTISPSGSELEASILLSGVMYVIPDSDNEKIKKDALLKILGIEEALAPGEAISLQKLQKAYEALFEIPDDTNELSAADESLSALAKAREAAIEEREKSMPEGLKHEALYGSGEPIHRRISVFGSMHRIGTTTASLQLVRYFLTKGDKAC